jgi:hypothetical protein
MKEYLAAGFTRGFSLETSKAWNKNLFGTVTTLPSFFGEKQIKTGACPSIFMSYAIRDCPRIPAQG